jgi:hypothetical protein
VNDLHRLRFRRDNARLVAAIQCATLHFLLRPVDSVFRQIADTNDSRNNCKKAGSAGRCDCLRSQRAACQEAGEKQDNGGPAAGR